MIAREMVDTDTDGCHICRPGYQQRTALLNTKEQLCIQVLLQVRQILLPSDVSPKPLKETKRRDILVDTVQSTANVIELCTHY